MDECSFSENSEFRNNGAPDWVEQPREPFEAAASDIVRTSLRTRMNVLLSYPQSFNLS